LGWGGVSLWRGDGSSCPLVRLVVFLLGASFVAATAGAAGRLSRASTAASEGSEVVSVQGSRAHRRSLIGALASAEVPSAADVQEVCVVAIFRCERLSVVGVGVGVGVGVSVLVLVFDAGVLVLVVGI
jgi:hypothetical protein